MDEAILIHKHWLVIIGCGGILIGMILALLLDYVNDWLTKRSNCHSRRR